MSKDTAMALAIGAPVSTPLPPAANLEAQKSQLVSAPFNALAKKEAELVRQQQAFKKEREQVSQEKEKLKPIWDKIQSFEKTKSENPIEAMKSLGFTETDIFNYLAAQEKKDPTPEERAALAASEAAEAKIKAFEDAQAKKIQEEQVRQDTVLIQGFKSQLSQMVKTDPVKFEYCNYYGPAAESLMYETALAVVRESKGTEVLTPLEAAQMVEEYYEEQDKLMSSLKKRTPVPRETPPETSQPTRTRTVHPPTSGVSEQIPKPTITKTRTLTNAATSTVASTRHTRNESREQKRERLMNALKEGKLG
jgi:hypothetical protein